MTNEQRRAVEMARQIKAAREKEPRGTGTKIEIEDGDWDIMVMALTLFAVQPISRKDQQRAES